MIYITNTTEAQTLMIPRNGVSSEGEMSLILRNTSDLQGFSIPVIDIAASGLYIRAAITLPEHTATGEYHYQLMSAEGELISCGLLSVGEFATAEQYNEPITFTQYDTE